MQHLKLRASKRAAATTAEFSPDADDHDTPLIRAGTPPPRPHAESSLTSAPSTAHGAHSTGDENRSDSTVHVSVEGHGLRGGAHAPSNFRLNGQLRVVVKRACSLASFLLRTARHRCQTLSSAFLARSNNAGSSHERNSHPHMNNYNKRSRARAGCLRRRRARLCLVLLLTLFVMGVLSDLLLGLAFLFLDVGTREVMGGGAVPPALLGDGSKVPWLDCDCTGASWMLPDASLRKARNTARETVQHSLEKVYTVVDPSCGFCDASVIAAGADSEAVVADLPSLLLASWQGQQAGFLSTLFLYVPAEVAQTGLRVATASMTALVDFFFRNTVALARLSKLLYGAHVEMQNARVLQDRQNRGVEGQPISPPSVWTFLSACWSTTFTATTTTTTNRTTLTGAGGDAPHAAAAAVEEERPGFAPLEPAFVVTNLHEDNDGAARLCAERAPLRRAGLPRHAMPWLAIRSPAYRRAASDWANTATGELTTLAPRRARKRHAGKEPAAATVTEEREAVPSVQEVTVAVASGLGGGVRFRSYFCGDLTNISRRGVDLFMDPRHRLAVRRAVAELSGAELPAELYHTQEPPSPRRRRQEETTTAVVQDDTQMTTAPLTRQPDCKACTVHCVHPRIARQLQARAAQRHAFASSAPATAISWDVNLEDVEAGWETVPGTASGHDAATSSTTPAIPLTRADLFTCTLLRPNSNSNFHDAQNSALLLSADVWLTHFGGTLPLFYVNHSFSVGWNGSSSSSQQEQQQQQPLSARVPTRLLPLHTATVYGESLQSFPDYALRPAHWNQFDAVYLPHRVRRAELLGSAPTPSATSPVGGRGNTDGGAAEAEEAHRRRRHQPLGDTAAAQSHQTRFATWNVGHLYLREFQLITYLNQQLRQLQKTDPRRRNLYARDIIQHVAEKPGVVPRMALELLHGADPLMLPLLGENLAHRAKGGEGWRPPSYATWHYTSSSASAKATTSNTATVTDGASTHHEKSTTPPAAGVSKLPFSPDGRIPAIAVAISHCWHGRLWWLSELSRYYPVHNFGRCAIPTPAPLPGDRRAASSEHKNKDNNNIYNHNTAATPADFAEGGAKEIPQRAHYPFPEECSARHLVQHHYSALKLSARRYTQAHTQSYNSSSSSSTVADAVPPNTTVGQPRALAHLPRDLELRCVFRKYRYVLAFENSIEDDYVTEKVYNALLSGALPLYVGAMNIDAYVPQSRRAGVKEEKEEEEDGATKENKNAKVTVRSSGNSSAASSAAVPSPSSTSVPAAQRGTSRGAAASMAPYGLPVLPVLQLFPLLNETAARMEERRILALHDMDEAVSSSVLQTHAAALRSRATRARGLTNYLKARQLKQEVSKQQQQTSGLSKAAAAAQLAERTKLVQWEAGVAAAEGLARALDEVALLAPQDSREEHFLLYNNSLLPRGAAVKKSTATAKHVKRGFAFQQQQQQQNGEGGQVSEAAGTWPPVFVAPHGRKATAVAAAAAANARREDGRVDGGLALLLGRAHAELRKVAAATLSKKKQRAAAEETQAALRAAQAPQNRGEVLSATSTPALVEKNENTTGGDALASVPSLAGLRAVRLRADRATALTANTAYGYAEEVGMLPRQEGPTRTTTSKSRATKESVEKPVESFSEDTQNFLKIIQVHSKGTLNTWSGETGAENSTLWYSPGDVYSRHFVRRALPPSSIYKAELKRAAAASPLNGFAQLAAYLRTLDADPTLVQRAGYFNWWRATSMEDFGEAFLEKLYEPHPICSICAAALEKKELMARREK